MEDRLDDVAAGRAAWTDVLADFWTPLAADVAGAAGTAVTDIVDAVDASLGASVLGDDRACPACGDGRLGVKLSSIGGFVGCCNYPACTYTRALHAEPDGGERGAAGEGGPEGGVRAPAEPAIVLLGDDPQTGLPITLRKGPYGMYVQLGPAPAAAVAVDAPAVADTAGAAAAAPKAKKTAVAKKARGPAKPPPPKRASLPKGVDPASLTLESALALLTYPRALGPHPAVGGPVEVARGPYGFYVRHWPPGVTPGAQRKLKGGVKLPGPPSCPLPAGEDPEAVSLETAIKLIADRQVVLAKKKGRGALTSPPSAAVAAAAGAAGGEAAAAPKPAKPRKPPTARKPSGAPRRPNAFILYCAAVRAGVAAELEAAKKAGSWNADAGAGGVPSIQKELGARWKGLGEGGQADWYAQAIELERAAAGAAATDKKEAKKKAGGGGV